MTADAAVLALDASGAACSVAVSRGSAVLAHRHRAMTRGHAEVLVPMVDETLGEAGLGFDEVGAVAVTVGPGSFTGVRAGLAAARGIALARDIPLIGIDSFEAIAHAMPLPERAGRAMVVAIDTKRRDLYLCAVLASGETAIEPCVARPEAAVDLLPAAPIALAGDGRHMLLPMLRGLDVREIAIDAPDARDVALLASRLAASRDTGRPALPLYLREPEAVVPKFGGRLRP